MAYGHIELLYFWIKIWLSLEKSLWLYAEVTGNRDQTWTSCNHAPRYQSALERLDLFTAIIMCGNKD